MYIHIIYIYIYIERERDRFVHTYVRTYVHTYIHTYIHIIDLACTSYGRRDRGSVSERVHIARMICSYSRLW